MRGRWVLLQNLCLTSCLQLFIQRGVTLLLLAFEENNLTEERIENGINKLNVDNSFLIFRRSILQKENHSLSM